MLQEKQYTREVAKKTSVVEILNDKSRQIKRANILATIVDKTSAGGAYKSMLADDGTGQIQLRFFDNEAQSYEKPEVGDFVLVIGKPRHYDEEKYIAPELVKPVRDVKWAEVRKLELMTGQQKTADTAGKIEVEDADGVSKDKIEVYRIVKELDTGKGADTTEVVIKCGNSNADSLIKEMIRAGDMFEVSPGKLKVLE